MTDDPLATARAWIEQALDAAYPDWWRGRCGELEHYWPRVLNGLAAALAAAVREDRTRIALLFQERYDTFHEIGTAEVRAFLWGRNVHDDLPPPPRTP